MLYRMVERVLHSKLKGDVVIATTDLSEDRIVEKICEQHEWNSYRGDPTDLLTRHYRAARLWNADVVVKIPSDCPLIDAHVIDLVIEYFLNNSYDYVSNLHPASYPDGNDVEVMSMDALEYAWVSAKRDFEREHTTPFIWENRDLFSIGNVRWDKSIDYSMSHRFTLDYPDDYRFILEVFERLYPRDPMFTLEDILNLLEEEPELMKINEKFSGVNWYRNHLHELRTIDESETRMIEQYGK